jgi:hypothetical protein
LRADLWAIRFGQEWKRSLEDTDPGDGRFLENVHALRDGYRR